MKILFTADLHYGIDIMTHERIRIMIEEMEIENPDLVVICGDIGEGSENIYQCLKLFKNLKCPIGVIIGNHDLWNYFGHSTNDLWETILHNMIEELGFIWMENEIVRIDDVAIIGGIAWYDYSSKGNNNFDDDWYFANKKNFNNDGNFIDWEYTDKEFAEICKLNMIKRLEESNNNIHVDKIIVATHVPILTKQSVKLSSDSPYGDAYFGNYTIGEEVMNYEKVRYIVSGHSHRGMKSKFLNKQLYVIDSDYGYPKYLSIEL